MPKTTNSRRFLVLADAACVAQVALEADWAGGARAVRDGTAIRWVWSQAEKPGEKARYTLSGQTLGSADSAVAKALRSGTVLLIHDLQAEPHPENAFLLRHGLRSALYLPLANRMGCGPVLVVGKRSGAWTANNLQLAQALVAPLARMIGHTGRLGRGQRPSAAPASPEATGRPSSATKPDARSSPRRDYPYRQKIAPVFNGVTPSPRRFREVQFRDLSTGGVSLYLDKAPTFDELVVSLGIPPDVSHVRARVVHVRPVEVDGETKYLVGCRFIGRVYL